MSRKTPPKSRNCRCSVYFSKPIKQSPSPKLLTSTKSPNQDTNDFFPTISSDNSQVYFVRETPAGSSIWQKNLSGKKTQLIPFSKEIQPEAFLKISPDGKSLVFRQGDDLSKTKKEKGNLTIGIVSLEDVSNKPRFIEIPAFSSDVSWSKNGMAFDYFQNTGKEAVLWRQSLELNSSPKEILRLPNQIVRNFAWSKDKKDLLVSQGGRISDVRLITNF